MLKIGQIAVELSKSKLSASKSAAAVLLASTILASASPAFSQALTGVITGNAQEGGTSTATADISGNGGGGITITGGTTTISYANLHNFTTVGGAGAGGGCGCGGLAFVGANATLVLNTVTVEGNIAKGGQGNTGALLGGSLNNLGSALSTGGTAATGTNGITWSDSTVLFGDGSGNGLDGTDAVEGASGANSNAIGGTGGVGGRGEPGWGFNPGLTYTLLKDSQQLDEDSALLAKAIEEEGADDTKAGDDAAEIGTDTEALVDDGVDAGSFAGATADPFEEGSAIAGEVQADLNLVDDGEKEAEEGVMEGADAANAAEDVPTVAELQTKVDEDTTNVATDTANLAEWHTLNALGQVGLGGAGGAGGPGGQGAFGLSGGAGGNGGNGGDGAGGAKGGNGGDGGDGGWGGFGAGGAAGGNGGTAGTGGNPSRDGSAGGGGLGGFGGGNGSSGTGYHQSVVTGGTGGSGLGGGIFVQAGGTLDIYGNVTFSQNFVYAGSAAGIGGADGGYAGTDLFIMTGANVYLDPCHGFAVNACGNTITFNGTIGDDSPSTIGAFGVQTPGAIGTGATIHIESGIVALNGADTYAGQTILDGGVLQASDGVGLPANSNLTFNGTFATGGVFETTTGAFTRFVGTDQNQVQWTGSGGFSAQAKDLTVTLSNNANLTWGQGNFVSGSNTLIFGTLEATNAVHFSNAIQLVGPDNILVVGANAASGAAAPTTDIAYLDGVLSGSGGLLVDGTNGGQLYLSNVETYTGVTTIDAGGSLFLGVDPGATGTVPGSISASSDIIDNGVFDISGTTGTSITTLDGTGMLNLGAQTLTLTAAHGSFGGVVQGTGGVTLAGGLQFLTGTNTYTGATTINNGTTLFLSGAGSIATSSNIIDNGVFDISLANGEEPITTLSGSGVVNLGANYLAFTAGSTTFSGGIAGSGGIEAMGGTQTLSGTNTFTGMTAVDAGATLALTGTGSIALSDEVYVNGTFDISGTTAGAAITTLSGMGVVNLGAQYLTLTDANDTFDGVIQGSGGLTLANGQEALTGTNTYTGVTTVDPNGMLYLIGTGSIAASSEVVDNGLLDISYTTNGAAITTLSGNGTVNLGNQYLTFSAAHDTFAGVVQGTGGLTAAGGTETLTGANTYTGWTTINSGATLALVGTGSIAQSQEVADNGTFDISGTSAGADITTLSGTGVVNLGAQYLTLTNANDMFHGVIQGSGGLTLAAGEEALSGTNTYTGVTTIDPAGALYLFGTGSIAQSSEVADNGVLDISYTTNGASIITLSRDGLVHLGAQTLTLTGAYDTFAGVIDGSGGFTVAAGAETLTGTNTYTGWTTINSGATLYLAGTGSVATSAGVNDNGTFDISGTNAGASIQTLEGLGLVNLGAQTLTITNASTSFAGVIQGSGGLTLSGGQQGLSGTNTYTGATLIDAGTTLYLTGTGSIAQSSGVADYGTFDISGTSAGASITTLSGNGRVTLGAQYLTLSGAQDTFSGVASGTGGLIVAAGAETLTGTNTYTGSTTINGAATLALAGTGSIATSSRVTDNGTFDISATSNGAAITTLTGVGHVNLGAEYLTFTAGSTTFAGFITGTGGLTAAGGTQTLTGTNTYTGVTTINSHAALDLSGIGSIAFSSEVADNGLLDISQTTAGAHITTLSGSGYVNLGAQYLIFTAAHDTFSGVTLGGGGFTVQGGTETLTGSDLYTGATTINAGATLALSGTGTIAASSGVIDNGTFSIAATTAGAAITTLSGSGSVLLGSRYLTFTAGSTTFAGGVSGAGGLIAAGGVQTLSGVNTYTGSTTINAGATLALSGSGSIAASSIVADSGTFNIAATTSGASIRTLSGAGLVTLGARTLTLTAAANTFAGVTSGTGGLTVAGGTEMLTGTNSFTGAATVGAGAVLDLVGTGSVATASSVVANGLFDISATGGASITTLAGNGVVNLGSQTLTVTNGSTTFNGVIYDPPGGSLVIAGGVQTLGGVNTYTGSTTINSGATLALTGSGSIATSSEVTDNGALDISGTSHGASLTTLAGSGAVNLGAQTLTLTAAYNTFSGAIAGTGGLAVTGGMETLSGISTYSGGTTIANAVVSINGDGALGAASGPISITNGSLIATSNWTSGRNIAITGAADISAAGSAVTLNGVISGAGSLVADGGGSITLNGSNTYSGGTDIVNGTAVYVANDAALGAPSGPVMVQNGSLNTTANLTTSRTIVLSQNGQLNTDGYQLMSSGEIEQDNNGVITPLLIGNATLTGTLQFQTGTGFVVSAGSLLRGVGTYYTPITVYGTLAPGNSPGTLTDVGTVTIEPQGALRIDIDGTGTGTGAGNFSRLIVAGAGNSFVAGGTLTPLLRGITGNASNTYTPPLTQSYTIVTAAGGVTGQFQTLVEPTGLAAGTRFDAIYSPNAITLWVAPSTYTNLSPLGVTLTPNQAAVGAGLDALRPPPGQRTDPATSAVLQTLYGETATQLPTQMDALSGVVYGEGLRYGLVKAAETRDIVDGVAQGQVLLGSPSGNQGHGHVWLTGVGSRTTLGSADARFTGGLAGGVDYWFAPDLLAGFGAAGGDGQLREKVNSDKLKTSSVEGFVYGAWLNSGNVYSAQGGFNHNDDTATRNLQLNGRVAQGKGDGYGYDVSAQVERPIPAGAWTLAPSLALSADSVQRKALAETGGSVVGLDVAQATASSVRSLLGASASAVWGSGTRFAFTGKLDWGHEFSDVEFSTVQAFEGAPGTLFATRTASPGRDGAVVGLTQTIAFSSGAQIAFKYQGDLRSNQTTQSASVGLSFHW